MLPKSSKHYILPTAEELGLNQQMVQDVVGFYYSKVRKNLVDMSHQKITVEHLGSFRVKRKELPLLIKKYNKHLGILTKDTFNQMALKKEVERKLEAVIKLQKALDTEKEKKQEFLKKKYGKDYRPSIKNLEV